MDALGRSMRYDAGVMASRTMCRRGWLVLVGTLGAGGLVRTGMLAQPPVIEWQAATDTIVVGWGI